MLGGSGFTITPTISISSDDITYTDYVGARQVFAENFRYVIYRLDFLALDDASIIKFSEFRATISLKLEEETGEVEVEAADVGGTRVNFIKDFLDIQDIQVTAQDSFGVPVWVKNDVPNPEYFDILLFDQDGTRIDGKVNYRARGAINP